MELVRLSHIRRKECVIKILELSVGPFLLGFKCCEFLHSEFFWGGVSRFAATPNDFCFVSGSWRYKLVSSIFTNRDWKSFGSRQNNPKFAQTPGTVDVYDPFSGFSGSSCRWASSCPNVHERRPQPDQLRCPVAQLLNLLKSGVLPRLYREFDQ